MATWRPGDLLIYLGFARVIRFVALGTMGAIQVPITSPSGQATALRAPGR
ncbi:hypothetical protein ACWHAO_26675 [Streptomyces albidoflavus]|nr:hypothetical protein OG794_11410 [Streptomyces albidoflavus]